MTNPVQYIKGLVELLEMGETRDGQLLDELARMEVARTARDHAAQLAADPNRPEEVRAWASEVAAGLRNLLDFGWKVRPSGSHERLLGELKTLLEGEVQDAA